MLKTIWILDDDDSMRWVMQRAFASVGYQAQAFDGAESMLAALQQQAAPGALFCDVRMPGMDGMQVLARLREQQPDLPVVIMTAHSDLESAVNAYQGGAFEYLPKPFDLDDAVKVAERAIQHHESQRAREHDQTSQKKQNPSDQSVSLGGIIGEAPAMQDVFRAIGRLSRSSVSVLLTGASGTGKELVASALHRHSPRADKPFIALNMAAIPADLIESELFGHEKGAFTGADKRRAGRFEQANGGTLFLDEIGDMPLAVQTRLLRVLAEGQFYPVGGHQPITVDVRVIAATHQALERLTEQGVFREDLYHRLNVIRLRLPPLAERRSDIPALANFFLQQAADELQVPVKRLSQAAIRQLQQAPWPGNVRQLQNSCRWLTVMAAGEFIEASDLPGDLFTCPMPSPNADEDSSDVGQWRLLLSQWLQQASQRALSEPAPQGILKELLPEIEQMAINIALQTTQGHKQEAAKLLGWGRNTLTRKLHEYNISE
ncbi:nitrogen regulation protein NR(I) [Idiomarina xiamenensis]|uniref:DNA-binding transcriptional regulator NtrC n=1 Tax=Idiomarina xiamenensis 10-D-4 TaxID=740709 RepID=K2JC82_9GAMM|nr:nitrogen regulation protein NR(I) [Idiomarina xiamenensis]EKE80921.1 nitrogen regulation protein [Idiomarina xiamenensis 10-D-4]